LNEAHALSAANIDRREDVHARESIATRQAGSATKTV
jgi:hypothetical protein